MKFALIAVVLLAWPMVRAQAQVSCGNDQPCGIRNEFCEIGGCNHFPGGSTSQEYFNSVMICPGPKYYTIKVDAVSGGGGYYGKVHARRVATDPALAGKTEFQKCFLHQKAQADGPACLCAIALLAAPPGCRCTFTPNCPST